MFIVDVFWFLFSFFPDLAMSGIDIAEKCASTKQFICNDKSKCALVLKERQLLLSLYSQKPSESVSKHSHPVLECCSMGPLKYQSGGDMAFLVLFLKNNLFCSASWNSFKLLERVEKRHNVEFFLMSCFSYSPADLEKFC